MEEVLQSFPRTWNGAFLFIAISSCDWNVVVQLQRVLKIYNVCFHTKSWSEETRLRVAFPDLPSEVDNFTGLCPLEPPAASPLHKSSTFGYVTTIYKAVIIKTGQHIFLR